jgi:NifU-like protein involved in Fe-S cluster formation
MYSPVLLDYFYHPQHALCNDRCTQMYYRATAGVLDNGDFIELYAKIKNNALSCVCYRIRAGVATMACTEFIARYAQDTSIDRLSKLTSDYVLGTLQLPKVRQNCAFLPLSALHNILKQHREAYCGNTET